MSDFTTNLFLTKQKCTMEANENDQLLVRSVQRGYRLDIMSAVCANKMLNVDRCTCENV